MKKRCLISLISLIIAIVLIMNKVTLAKTNNENQTQNSFLSIDKIENVAGEKEKITIDLSKIEYTDFYIVINSNSKVLDSITNDNDNLKIEKENDDEVRININKKEMNIKSMDLYIIIPEDSNNGDFVTIEAIIVSNEETQEDLKEKVMIRIVESLESEEKSENSKKDSNQLNSKENENKEKTQNKEEEQSKSSGSKKSQSNSIKTTSISGISSKSASSSEIYQGSNNAYLTNITVNGYSLLPEFSITSTTYFLEVDNSVTSLEIETEKYDKTETVTIYGNENLNIGENKVLIKVTAENGNTRTYRIIVTRKN